RVTMKDIAEKAGVSVSTVSLALSGHSRIPERRRRQIRDIAAQLGYDGVRSQPQLGPTLGLLISNPAGLTNLNNALDGILSEATTASAPVQLFELNGPHTKSADDFVRLLQRSGVNGGVVLGGSFPQHI